MKASLPVQIKLTESEQQLFDQIDFDPKGAFQLSTGKASHELVDSLLKRKAIPSPRMFDFYSKDAYPRGRGKSRFESIQFGLLGKNIDVYECSQFVRNYLRYFVCGPMLSPETMERFCQIVNDDVDWGETLLKFVRKEVRNTEPLKRTYLPEGFYKLALECLPYSDPLAESVRKAAMQVR